MRRSFSSLRSFTLIEMLAAVSILTFMMFAMVQITNMTEQAWHAEQGRIDNFTKARSMADMINDDLERAVFRGDLPIFGTGAPATTPTNTSSGLYYFTGTSATNAFYTRLPGVPSTSTTAVRDLYLVIYTLNSTNQVLERSDLAVPWSSSQNIAFQGDMTSLLQNATPRQMAPGVVGFLLAFRRTDGKLYPLSEYTGYNSTNAVVAIDVAMAVIGNQSMAALSTNQLASIQNSFAAATNFVNGTTNYSGVKACWDQTVLTPAFYSSYPQGLGLGEGLQCFERWVACPAF
ncbi:MAG: hypothetical protein LV481_02710 [Methylacidiphilales bacterium]|nr:hypothetical protein [Candidatus Methylacidiphilales bacterium]